MITPEDLQQTVEMLRTAGCVAPKAEARELVAAAGGDASRLHALADRRASGEPLAWLVGSVGFCGERILVHTGIYVPRPQTEHLALEAVARLPEHGIAVDLCTGCGAVAVALSSRRRQARVLGTEIDAAAARCAAANGVEVVLGDMTAGLPEDLAGRVDVVTAVVPYVPTAELRLLPRDVRAYEPLHALHGGSDGMTFLRRAAAEAAPLLRPGGSLLLELGGDQGRLLAPVLAELGYRDIELHLDQEGDLRAIFCRR